VHAEFKSKEGGGSGWTVYSSVYQSLHPNKVGLLRRGREKNSLEGGKTVSGPSLAKEKGNQSDCRGMTIISETNIENGGTKKEKKGSKRKLVRRRGKGLFQRKGEKAIQGGQ